MEMANCSPHSLLFLLQPVSKKKGAGKKVAAAPLATKKVEVKKVVNPLFEKRPKNYGIGECMLFQKTVFLQFYSKTSVH